MANSAFPIDGQRGTFERRLVVIQSISWPFDGRERTSHRARSFEASQSTYACQ
jgi:hypothetical protein